MNVFRVAGLIIGIVLLIAAFKIRIPGRYFRLAVGAVALMLLVSASFGLSGPRAVARQGWLIVSGGLVDVNGHRLRIDCQGSGSPAVVLDAGLNQTHYTWGRVPEKVAAFTQVCTYDRANLGESDAVPGPRTSAEIAEDLYALLRNRGVRAPYILVGHSFGGLNVRLFASRYPDDAAGIVLVDASPEDQTAQFAVLMLPEVREAYLRMEAGENDEHADIISSNEQVKTAHLLPKIPLTVLTAKSDVPPADARFAQKSHELQAQLARLVPNGRQIIVEHSGHFIQLDQPDIVVHEIWELTVAIRSATPSPSAK